VLLGVSLGVVASLMLTRLLASMLYQEKANDPVIFVTVSAALLCVAASASLVPALRAARVDPMRALRCE
jgi:ABC-type lipoprotein release transport system permease subunit